MTLIGWVLVAGFVSFMVGAGGWRIEYEQPAEVSLPIMHGDRRRLRWIHWWMIPGVALTTSGLGGLGLVAREPAIGLAAVTYAIGAILWIAALAFRLTVGEWAAEHTASTGEVPSVYLPLARWAGLGHTIHMGTAYVSAVPLAWGASETGLIVGWLAWAGTFWAVTLAALFLIARTRFIAAPPFWAHVFTFAVGLSILL